MSLLYCCFQEQSFKYLTLSDVQIIWAIQRANNDSVIQSIKLLGVKRQIISYQDVFQKKSVSKDVFLQNTGSLNNKG